MTDFAVKKRLLCSGQRIPVPDVWGKIKDAPIKKAEIPVRRGYFAIACVASACVLVAVTTALLIPAMTAGWNNDLSLTGGLNGDYSAGADWGQGDSNLEQDPGIVGEAVTSTAPQTGDRPTALQMLSVRQYHGELRQTTMSENDVSSMLSTNFDLENVYEDETYLYAFEMSGALKEMVNTCDGLGSGMADETAIRSAVADCFAQYLPNEDMNEYEIIIDRHEDAYPAWTVKAEKYADGIIISKISLTFDSDGRLLRLIVPEEPDLSDVTAQQSYDGALSLLSHQDAVQIALSEAAKEEYGLIIPPEANTGPVYTTSIETRTKTEVGETIVYYSVEIGNLPLKASPNDTLSLMVSINAQTGEVIGVEKSMILTGVDLPPEP